MNSKQTLEWARDLLRGSAKPVNEGSVAFDLELELIETLNKLQASKEVGRKPLKRTSRRGPRYTPLSKRQDRPAAIHWLVSFYPQLSDGQISRLVGTTKPTIQAIRDGTHWNIHNIQPIDPVALGMCTQDELDEELVRAEETSFLLFDDVEEDDEAIADSAAAEEDGSYEA